jgi:1-deoxy-D-xylulose-5-phosphate reductoisomerase
MNKRKRVVILGSTGSIGLSALKVARDIPDRMEVVALVANRQADVLLEQAKEFKPKLVGLNDASCAKGLAAQLPSGVRYAEGPQALIEAATLPEADMVLVAIVGTAGLAPALAALKAGKELAVASKEILVMAGEEVMKEAQQRGLKILPVDSEHNAIFQCLNGAQTHQVKRLILTASGGPFRQTKQADLEKVTLEQALKHPTWNMGRKITIDSATLFNKGLEMIEARWLFNIPMPQVDVVVHPQSIVHSLVEFVDGSQLAQLSHSDMCFPIQYAVTYPDRLPNRLKPLQLAEVGALTFEAPDPDRFPALRLARWAGEVGGTLPAVLNAANEVAVEAFLQRRIAFPEIWRSVERTMKAHPVIAHPALDAIIQADQWARKETLQHLVLQQVSAVS